MKSSRNGDTIEIKIEGSLGESSPLYTLPLQGAKNIVLDLAQMTYMNSIGVKQWIIWSDKIPRDCQVKLINCPMMMASQASAVVGFMKPNMKIESVNLPYACDECGNEDSHKIVRGKEYEYAGGGLPERIELVDPMKCRKCGKDTLVPDVIIAKTFKFLKE